MADLEQWRRVSDDPLGECVFSSHYGYQTIIPVGVLSCAGSDDLCEVLSAVNPLRASAYNFAILLGLPPDLVDSIEGRGSDPVGFLTRVLTHWLRSNYNTTKHGRPSWRMVCAAAASPVGGANPALANKIADEHSIDIVHEL